MHPTPQRLHGEHADPVGRQQVVDLRDAVHGHAQRKMLCRRVRRSRNRRCHDSQLGRGVAGLTPVELPVVVQRVRRVVRHLHTSGQRGVEVRRPCVVEGRTRQMGDVSEGRRAGLGLLVGVGGQVGGVDVVGVEGYVWGTVVVGEVWGNLLYIAVGCDVGVVRQMRLSGWRRDGVR